MHEISVVDVELMMRPALLLVWETCITLRTFRLAFIQGNIDVLDRKAPNKWWYGALFRQAVKVSNKRSLFCVSAARKSLSIKATDLAFRISIGSRRKVPSLNGLRSIFSQMIFPATSATFFGGHSSSAKIDLMSPDNTSDGWLRKSGQSSTASAASLKRQWRTQQEPYNEVIASELMEKLNILMFPIGSLCRAIILTAFAKTLSMRTQNLSLLTTS